MAEEFEELFDPKAVPKNQAGDKAVDKAALDYVNKLFDNLVKIRCFSRGGKEVRITDLWDENYRIYRAIKDPNDHNYDGESDVFLPVARKSVNVIESESSNALFSRDDYYKVEGIGSSTTNQDMARRAWSVLKHYSDEEGYVDNYDLALKQCLIYGCTAMEVVFVKDEQENIFKRMTKEPMKDETGEPLINKETGEPLFERKFNIVKQKIIIERPRVEVRDIYRVYVNHASEDPEKEDVIYKDAMSRQKLLMMAEQGVYNKAAVERLIKLQPTSDQSSSIDDDNDLGEGKTYIGSSIRGSDVMDGRYEVLRFQGLFSTKDTEGNTIMEPYWIDIGERKEVLRVQKNPLLGKYKTFSLVNYDTMVSEFYTDGVIDPIKSLQYEINDKEAQSLDGLGFDLSAPWEVLKGSRVTERDILESRKKPNKVFFTSAIGSIKKLTTNPNLSHLNMELQRLHNYSETVTGATSLAGGSPTGTQADRSGKALGILQNQTKSQFSKFIRKFERKMLERTLQKVWSLIVQFSNDTVEIELLGENNGRSAHSQRVEEIVGQFNIKVRGGSEYIKEREIKDSILEFMSILGTNDVFQNMMNPEPMLIDIAKSSAHDMSKYVDPNNLYQKQQQMIQQLQQALNMTQGKVQVYGSEINRLSSELQQTNRSAATASPINPEGEDVGR